MIDEYTDYTDYRLKQLEQGLKERQQGSISSGCLGLILFWWLGIITHFLMDTTGLKPWLIQFWHGFWS